MIDLCLLGTGGALPLPDRGLSSVYIRLNGRAVLVDCGESTQTAIRRLGWGFRCIDALLITHYHGDHCSGLPGFLLSLGKTGRTEPFHIYGPVGLRRVVEGLCVIVPGLPFELVLHEMEFADTQWELLGMKVNAFCLNHGMPCFGYRFELPRAASFDPARAKALGVPVTLWRSLQAGETVEADGRVITPGDVMGKARRGIRFLIATDTRPVPAIAEMGRDSDLMILEGMYGSEDKLPQALKNHHMLFREAAELAKEAGTKRLILTHFSNCVEDPQALLPSARAVFPAAEAGSDLMTVRLDFGPRYEAETEE